MTTAVLNAAPISLRIEPIGAHKFAYTKVETETGEAVWRWPREAPLAQRLEAKGQLLDLSV